MTHTFSMMAYSMTEAFTAVAILQLLGRGQIRLEDELNGYLPENPYE
jgi:CubicO group peptidase (beta-lactamase class C family)